MAARARPLRTIQNASPIAWLADEHALDTVKAGPVTTRSMVTWLTAALIISRGTVRGITRLCPWA